MLTSVIVILLHLCWLKYTVPLWWESWVCSFHHHYPAGEFHVTTPLAVVACRYVDSSSVPQNERLGAEQCWQHNPYLHPEAYKITSMLMLCLKNSGSLSLKTAYSAAAASSRSNHFLELWSSDHNQIAWMQIEERFDLLELKHTQYYDAFLSLSLPFCFWIHMRKHALSLVQSAASSDSSFMELKVLKFLVQKRQLFIKHTQRHPQQLPASV